MLKQIIVFFGFSVWLSTLCSGCFWVGESVGTKLDNEAKKDLTAAIERKYHCSQEQISLTCLKSKDWGNERCQKWEFAACGHAGIFTITFDANTGVTSWVLTSYSKL